MKFFLSILLVLTLTLMAGAGYYYKQYQTFTNTNVFQQSTVINIEKGQNFNDFMNTLVQNEANGKKWQWKLFAKLKKVDRWLKVGEFNVSKDLKPLQMMQKIKKNQVLTYQFTIIEGMNWRELKQKLLTDPILTKTINEIDDKQLLQKLDSDKTTPEGLFLPETYQFVRGDQDIDILTRAHKALKQALQQAWQEREKKIPLSSSYQLLTLASIVEKETSQSSERSKIAGVFSRRLQLNMRLQTDPTVIYGLGLRYDGDIKYKDLKTDTAYNTYTRKGLPPTPIAMASKEAIIASAHPQEGRALYFVANNRGGHYFSNTYEQHQKAVKAYLKGTKL
jgi:UPF0755 protein